MKHEEESATKAEPTTSVETPVVETPVVEEKEPEIEKTIKIPTFEELQARNKTIQSVMETAAKVEETPVVEEKPIIESQVKVEKPTYESRVQRVDYEDQFKKTVEPVLMDVYAKQQKQIEDLEEELSKTKFDLFEKQKEALSLSNEKEEIKKKNEELAEQLTGVQKKMDGILSVLQDK
jgi:predicted unusual protein kinase regulating ubiquinone biosynthesis (AarF/ABC1/UbiB family)